MKWQNLYIPDLNNVFAVPIPDASYKLLDRIVIVRSGYPVSSKSHSNNQIIDVCWI